MQVEGKKVKGEQMMMTQLLGKNKQLKIQWLDTAKFCSGKWYISQFDLDLFNPHKLTKWYLPQLYHKSSCIVIQNNWIIGNPAKVKRAKAAKHWFLSDDSAACSGLAAPSLIRRM